jgi:hypothetical protein
LRHNIAVDCCRIRYHCRTGVGVSHRAQLRLSPGFYVKEALLKRLWP